MAEPFPSQPLDDEPVDDVEELLAGYVLGDLSPAEAEQVQRLLTDCPDLVNQVDQLREILATIPYSLPAVMPSASLRTSVLTATTNLPDARSPQRTGRSPRLVWGSVAAMLVVALGLDNARLRQTMNTNQAQLAQQRQLIAMLQEPQTRLISLKGMDRMATASGSALVTPGHTEAILVLQNLPDLPEEQYYCLWAIMGQRKVAIGEFEPNPQGKVFVKVPVATIPELTGLAVTIENPPAPPAPTGQLVMTSNL